MSPQKTNPQAMLIFLSALSILVLTLYSPQSSAAENRSSQGAECESVFEKFTATAKGGTCNATLESIVEGDSRRNGKENALEKILESAYSILSCEEGCMAIDEPKIIQSNVDSAKLLESGTQKTFNGIMRALDACMIKWKDKALCYENLVRDKVFYGISEVTVSATVEQKCIQIED